MEDERISLFRSEFLTDEVGNTLVQVEVKDEKGRVKLSVISFDDYLALLKGNREASREFAEIDGDFLPKEGFKKVWFSDRSNFTVVYVVSKKVRFFKYQHKETIKTYEVPYPDTVVVLSVRSGNIANRRCYALKKDGFHLYQFPYSNVSSEGFICTGNSVFNFEEQCVDDFFAEFTEEEHNDDYMTAKHYASDMPFGEFLKSLDGQTEFPESELIESSGGITDMKTLLEYAEKLAAQ